MIIIIIVILWINNDYNDDKYVCCDHCTNVAYIFTFNHSDWILHTCVALLCCRWTKCFLSWRFVAKSTEAFQSLSFVFTLLIYWHFCLNECDFENVYDDILLLWWYVFFLCCLLIHLRWKVQKVSFCFEDGSC